MNEISFGLLMATMLCAIVTIFGSIINPAIGFPCLIATIVNGALSCAALGE